MSEVHGEIITAYNLKSREKDRPMVVTGIYRYAPKKEGGASRFRLGGEDADSRDGMSKFCSEAFAKDAARELGIKIEDAVAKPSTRGKKKSCKEIGEGAEERCHTTRSKKAPAKKAAPKKAPAKKAAPKKAPAKKAAPKKKAPARKSRAKKVSSEE